LLFNGTLEFVTVTNPVVALLGTAAVRKVPDLTIGIAGVPLKETVLVKLKPWPRMLTVPLTFPELNGGAKLTNGFRPASRLNTVPPFEVPPRLVDP